MNKKIIFKKNQASKFAYFSLMFVAGTSIEQVNELGISHLIEHLLIRAGNEQSLNELFDMNGAAIKGETSRDYINLSGYCLAEDFNKIFKILISRIFNLSITEDELLREKKIVLIELNQYENSKKSINDNRVIFKNSSWSIDIIGTRGNIEYVSLETIYKFYIKNIQAGEFQIAIAGPSFLQSEIISIENMLPLSGSSVEINSPAFSTGLTELDKQQELSEISMYLDISGMVASSHEMAMLSILNSMLTGIKDSLLGHKLRTQKQWIYSIVSYPIFYSNMTLLKIVTITPTIYKKKLIKTLENNLVNESDLSDELLFYKAKKRVINELYINCEVNKNEYLKTICREKLFDIPSWDSIAEELELISLDELKSFSKKAIIQNRNYHIVIK